MLRRVLAVAAILPLGAVPTRAADLEHAPPPAPYRKVSELVRLPDFVPGLGRLFVNPQTLPAGPFLGYDHNGWLVSTTYMIPLKEIDQHRKLDGLSAPGGRVDHVDMYYAAFPSIADIVARKVVPARGI